MTTNLGISCTFGLFCLYFVNVYQLFVFASFPFGFRGAMWNFIVLI